MAIRPTAIFSETFAVIRSDFQYYFLRALAMWAMISATSVLVASIGVIALIPIIASVRLEDFAWTPTVYALLGAIGVFGFVLIIFFLSLSLGLIRSYTKAILLEEKRYWLFMPLGQTLTYLLVYLIPLVVPILLGIPLVLFGLIGIPFFVLGALVSGFLFIHLLLVPPTMAMRGENAFRAASRVWHMLRGQRCRFIGATLLLFLAYIGATLVVTILSMLPGIGFVISIAANVLTIMYLSVWYVIAYRQASE